MQTTKRIVKLGGSLLAQPRLFVRLRHWLDDQAPAATLIVTGGGAAVDWWRRLDAVHDLSSELAHDLSLRSMTENARVVSACLAENIWVQSLSDPALGGNVVAVADPAKLVKDLEATTTRPMLRRSWNVSADSIAAWIGLVWMADELVLLKSRSEPRDRSTWARSGFVDTAFDDLNFPYEQIRCVDLAAGNCQRVSDSCRGKHKTGS